MGIEIWRDVKDYEGIYQVSNLGNVKSLDRYTSIRGRKALLKERILKPTFSGKINPYKAVILCKNGTTRTYQVHKLVAVAFLNHIPNGMSLVVNHIDFNKENNNVENLEIVTQRENANRKHIKSSSQYTGVSWYKSRNKWVSNIFIDGKLNFLGYFKNEIDAHHAYQSKLNELKN